MKRIIYAAYVTIGLATVAALRAFNPQPDPPKVFGMVGITLGETGRLNVVVPGTSTPGSTAPPACRVVAGR